MSTAHEPDCDGLHALRQHCNAPPPVVGADQSRGSASRPGVPRRAVALELAPYAVFVLAYWPVTAIVAGLDAAHLGAAALYVGGAIYTLPQGAGWLLQRRRFVAYAMFVGRLTVMIIFLGAVTTIKNCDDAPCVGSSESWANAVAYTTFALLAAQSLASAIALALTLRREQPQIAP